MTAVGEVLGALAQLGVLAAFVVIVCAVDGIVRDVQSWRRSR